MNTVNGQMELSSGDTLFWRTDPSVGCREYFSDEIGGGVFVWNTALVDDTTLLAAILQERMLQRIELREQRKASCARNPLEQAEHRELAAALRKLHAEVTQSDGGESEMMALVRRAADALEGRVHENDSSVPAV